MIKMFITDLKSMRLWLLYVPTVQAFYNTIIKTSFRLRKVIKCRIFFFLGQF